ncbi:MAG: IS66 family transposase, partial [Desulfobulbaceae bacterium]|nr:IS66 family transposase [Desulfobulbaceae bacterium]
MADKNDIEISLAVLEKAPRETLIQIIQFLLAKVERLEKRVEELEAKLNRNSTNSNQPPSADSPYAKGKANGEKKTRKPRRGHRQQMLEPTETKAIPPERCSCGCSEFNDLRPYYTHQHIELPEIAMLVTHFVLHQGRCQGCGKLAKGYTPKEYQTGYGPRLSALIAEIGGIDGNSRETIQTFLASVLQVPISQGAIQKVIDRGSRAIEPHYEAIKETARSIEINHLDETAWHDAGKLKWLWVMANTAVAFFMIHANRSKEAFETLIGAWNGILVSDNYAVYQKWANLRQNCLAHLIRRAKGLAERSDPELSRCGNWAGNELKLLCGWGKDPPSVAEWNAFYARLCRLIALYRDSKSDAGKFVRSIEEHMDSLFTFLLKEGVEPTNNFAERMIRYAVLWRKRSQGTNSDKGCRWVERIVSLRQTCRLQNRSTFASLVDAFAC